MAPVNITAWCHFCDTKQADINIWKGCFKHFCRHWTWKETPLNLLRLLQNCPIMTSFRLPWEFTCIKQKNQSCAKYILKNTINIIYFKSYKLKIGLQNEMQVSILGCHHCCSCFKQIHNTSSTTTATAITTNNNSLNNNRTRRSCAQLNTCDYMEAIAV